MMQRLMVKIQNFIVSVLENVIRLVQSAAAGAVRGLKAAISGVKRFF